MTLFWNLKLCLLHQLSISFANSFERAEKIHFSEKHFAANVRLMGGKVAVDGFDRGADCLRSRRILSGRRSLERQPIESSSIRIHLEYTFDYLLIDACRVPLASHRWLINVRLNVQFRITRLDSIRAILVLYQISSSPFPLISFSPCFRSIMTNDRYLWIPFIYVRVPWGISMSSFNNFWTIDFFPLIFERWNRKMRSKLFFEEERWFKNVFGHHFHQKLRSISVSRGNFYHLRFHPYVYRNETLSALTGSHDTFPVFGKIKWDCFAS